ncbi:hypothetical protein KW805_03660 [Candidatus Pacearchaeota archaeon]|nr:hypothetical protein [Candidatus Pacearchaeota archaeon]
MDKTLPKRRFPEGYKINPTTLAAGKYGTKEMVETWGQERTFDYILKVQGQGARTLSRLHADILAGDVAEEIVSKANLNYINPDRIREIEEKTGHDMIAINRSLEESVSDAAKPHIGELKTSADGTQPSRALQLRSSLEVVADSVENLRDIAIEKSLKWIDKPHMDVTHGYDALPTVAGRPLSHYVEMLQSGLNVLKFFYNTSIMGKWGDATGNHHSATAAGVDGIKLQEEYCKDLGIGHMDASAQVPGLEFEMDVVYALQRLTQTMSNMAKYIAWGRSDDVNIFINDSPKKKKGSSAMPHKDAKNGNPDVEEQITSIRNYMMGVMTVAQANCEMQYARNLTASANMRICLDASFKTVDHGIRNLADTLYWIKLRETRAKERVLRSHGVVTSQQVMTYLTDPRKTNSPMPRSEAHDLMGRLATQAWELQRNFTDIVLGEPQVTSRLDESTIRQITDPLTYIGQSKEIVALIGNKYYKKKTLGKVNEI